MAITSYLSRVIYKTASDSWGGNYNLLVNAKTIPSLISPPNTVESTTLEDDTQTFEMGIKTSDSKEITGNLTKEHYQNLDNLSDSRLNVIVLYGTDGVGGELKVACQGQVTVSPSDIGGVDEIVEMTVTLIPNTAPVEITDSITVTDNKDGTFTVTAA